MTNTDKGARLYICQAMDRVDIKVFYENFGDSHYWLKQYVILGWHNNSGTFRGIYYQIATKKYFFGTLSGGHLPDKLETLGKDGKALIPKAFRNAIMEVLQTKRTLTLSKGKPQ